MAERSTGRKPAPARKPKKETAPASSPLATRPKISDLKVRSQLEKGIAELQGLHQLLLSSDVAPDVLADFRDALNRVRNAAWAAQQYVIRKHTEQDSTSVRSFLAGERIRTAYLLCQALANDLKRTNLDVQRGSLVQLYEVAETLTGRLKAVIDRLE
jgi:hypothetical protein